MTNTKHTPAPWNYTLGYTREEYFIGNEDNDVGTATKKADARLISAAPELLAFAKATAQIFGKDTMIGAEAREAIKKAGG